MQINTFHISKIREYICSFGLPSIAKSEFYLDRKGLPGECAEIEQAINDAVNWLCYAQDSSVTLDGGVSHSYSLIDGWASSYPETTGYIIPTLIHYGKSNNKPEILNRCRKMLDWLLEIQFEEGGFQGGKVDALPRVPVTFNTGQILIGLASGVKVFGDRYMDSMCRAANWLSSTIDEDGCWRKHPTPFANPGEKSYETHVAWGLFEASRVAPNIGYDDVAIKNIEWALTLQNDEGWFDSCCLDDPKAPLTHTLGYVLRGIIEAHRYTQNSQYLESAMKTADSLMSCVSKEGALPGRLNPDWSSCSNWVCLTGSVQIAYCWLYLYQTTGLQKYFDSAVLVNRFVRKTQHNSGNVATKGGIKGAFPVDGDYGKYQYLNWAAKFFIDSHQLELNLRKGS